MEQVAQDAALPAAQANRYRWWLVAIEGIVALLLGIAVIADPVRASYTIRQVIALVLLVVSAGQIVDGFRFRGQAISPWATLRGGIGAAAALLTLLFEWSHAITTTVAREMLALGLLAYGIIGIVALIFTFRDTDFRMAALILDALTVVLGLLLLRADAENVSDVQLLGGAAIIGGVALIIYAYVLWSRRRVTG